MSGTLCFSDKKRHPLPIEFTGLEGDFILIYLQKSGYYTMMYLSIRLLGKKDNYQFIACEYFLYNNLVERSENQ